MRVSGRQEVTEAHMQNESCPRRARRRKAHRRGSQQAGRIGRAKGKRGRSFCGLMKKLRQDVAPRRKICRVDCRNFQTGKCDNDWPMTIWNPALGPLVDCVFRERIGGQPASVRNCFRSASAADDFSNCESRCRVHARSNNGFKIQLQGNRNPKRKITPAL